MQKNIIYIKNPDDLTINFPGNENAELIFLIKQSCEHKYSYTFNLKEKNSSAKILFLILADTEAKLDFKINVNHENSNTNLELKFKTVLYKNADLSFIGNIFVKENLESVRSSMTHHNILESKDAKIISKPNLEINSDEVEINHGFASGEFSKEIIHYLKSRGIDEKRIKKELIKSFLFKELSNKLPKELKKQIKKDILCSMPKK